MKSNLTAINDIEVNPSPRNSVSKGMGINIFRRRVYFTALALAALLFAMPAPAPAGVDVSITIAPPVPPVYAQRSDVSKIASSIINRQISADRREKHNDKVAPK